MLRNRKEEKNLDYQKLNEGIRIGVSILKILFILIVALLIFVVSKLLFDWKIIPLIKTILGVISPFFIGIVLAWLFDPLVTKLNKKGVNRILATVFVFVLFLGGGFLLIRLILPSIITQINDIVASAPAFFKSLSEWIEGAFDQLSSMTQYDFTEIKTQVYQSISQLGSSITVDLPTTVVNVITNLISGGVTFIFGLIIGFYMLFDFHNVRKHLMAFVPKRFHKDTIVLTNRLNKNLRSYVQGTFLIMFILFCFQSLGLTLAGMKAPLVFGLFCAITNVIPYVGPYIGGIPTVLVGFSISPLVGTLCLVSVVIAQVLESYFLQPVVMGKTMKLHPVTIMLGLLIFGHFFGILGMILATPTISICKTIFQFFDEKFDFVGKIREE